MKRNYRSFNALFTCASVAAFLMGNSAFASRLTNESFRFQAGFFQDGAGNTQGNPSFLGYSTQGTDPTMSVLLRAIGPGLAQFGVTNYAAQPGLSLLAATTATLQNQDNSMLLDSSGPFWNQDRVSGDLVTDTLSAIFQEVGAFPLVPYDPSKSASSQPLSYNAALVETRPLGNYSAEGLTTGSLSNGVTQPNSSGIMLMELYDINRSPGARLGNISGRTVCGNGAANGIIIGFNIAADDQGGAPMQLLIRGIGPGLLGFGLVDAQSAAVLELVDSSGNEIASNAGWDTNPPSSTANGIVVQPATAAIMSGAGAFPLQPGGKDAAFVVTLPVGTYTFLVHGADYGTGSAEGEVYVIH
jgi:hypothetical protein